MNTDRVITDVTARSLYGSNGRATVEVTVGDRAGRTARVLAPSAPTAGTDAEGLVQLEDRMLQPALAAADPAVRVVTAMVAPALRGADAADLTCADLRLDGLDPTRARALVGGNVTVAASMAVARLGALQRHLPLHSHLRDFAASSPDTAVLPLPAVALIDGGPGPRSKVPGTEFLLFPPPDTAVSEAVQTGIRVRERILAHCHRRGYEGGDSHQGALSVPLRTCEEGLEMVQNALTNADRKSGYGLGLDMAASHVLHEGAYRFRWAAEPLPPAALLGCYLDWIDEFGLAYLEDGFAGPHADWSARLTTAAAGRTMVAADGLFASDPDRITAGAGLGWADTVVLTPGRAGTTSEALRAAHATRRAGLNLLVSQHGGEGGGSFISSLALAAGARYVKTGGTSRTERIAQINKLIRLEGSA